MSVSIGQGDESASVELGVFCGWETASSQIRVCIVIGAMYISFLAHRSVINES